MFEDNSSFEVEVSSTDTIFPSSHHIDKPITIPLSIIDATVSSFGRAACIFYHDPPPTGPTPPSLSTYQKSLSKTLDSYPQWCGRLTFNPGSKPDRGHTNRYRRITLTYGTPSDLGVQFITAKSPKILSFFLPTTASRRSPPLNAWDASSFPSSSLLPSTPLALSSASKADSPNIIIQHTTFACGSIALAISITHSLADAHSLSRFAHDWAATNSSLLSNSQLPTLSPIFNPQLLDHSAAGDIDAASPDPELQRAALDLPCLRHDWYTPVPGQPWPSKIPSDWQDQDLSTLSPSTSIPWSDWDVKAPVTHQVFHFTATSLQRIYTSALTSTQISDSSISKLDALLAHLWQLISKARQTPQKYLTLTFGLRSRTRPPLPDNFLGSPIMLTAIPSPVTATAIRRNLNCFSPSNVGAHLHAAAFETSPQRLWQAMLGSKSLLVTTWLRLGFDEVRFGREMDGVGALRWVQPVMEACDGLLVVLEGLKGDEVGNTDGKGKGMGNGHWSDNGVDVCLFLEQGAMARLSEDEELFGG